MASARHPSNYLPSVVGNDVRHQISVAPADQTGIHISDLEEVVHGEITGSTAVSTNLSKSFRRTDNRAWRSLSCLELRPGRSDALTRVSCKPRGQSTYPQNYDTSTSRFRWAWQPDPPGRPSTGESFWPAGIPRHCFMGRPSHSCHQVLMVSQNN